MITLTIVVTLLLLIISGIEPVRSKRSAFENNRLSRQGKISSIDLSRDSQYHNVLAIRRILSALLLVSLVPVAISAFGWLWGVVLGVVVALEYQVLADTKPISYLSAKFYGLVEPYVLKFCDKFRRPITLLIASQSSQPSGDIVISSKDELKSVLKKGTIPLSSLEKTLLSSTLNFETRAVSEIMTPKSVIESIDHNELLGPILLDELHKTGHSRFPVTAGDIDHVVGILYVRDLLVVDGTKNSKKVSQVMDEEVCFIHEDQDLAHALKAFIKTEKLLFIVVNSYRETVGLITLEDVIEALIGQKINDEFEQHTDLRAVAAQNIRANNSPNKANNV